MALGLAHIFIRDDCVDEAYIHNYVYGYDAYKAYVSRFTPSRVEQLTGVPTAQLEAAAAMIAKNLPMAINESAAPLAHHYNGFQNYRAIMSLSAILGCFDRAGGQIPVQFSYNYIAGGFPTREDAFILAHRDRACASPVGAERFPLWDAFIQEAQANDLTRQVETKAPYPIRAMLGFGVNYRISPGDERLRQALLSMDFLVNTDLFLTDTCKLCDIVLPACTSYERGELKSYSGGFLYLTKPVIQPLYQSKSDAQIICELSKAMDLDDELLPLGVDVCLSDILRDLPITLDQLQSADGMVPVPGTTPYAPGSTLAKGLGTKSGKFELYAQAIEPYSWLDPLPTYQPPESPDVAYPYLMSSSPRITGALHSRLHDMPWARTFRPEPMVEISPSDANDLHISEGDWVELSSRTGSIQVKAHITYKAEPGVVCLYHGYPEADANLLTDSQRLDPYSGFPCFRETRIQIRRVCDG